MINLEVPLHVKQAVLVQSSMLNVGKSCWLMKQVCLTSSVWLTLGLQGNMSMRS